MVLTLAGGKQPAQPVVTGFDQKLQVEPAASHTLWEQPSQPESGSLRVLARLVTLQSRHRRVPMALPMLQLARRRQDLQVRPARAPGPGCHWQHSVTGQAAYESGKWGAKDALTK
jgi:hypothetical protein